MQFRNTSILLFVLPMMAVADVEYADGVTWNYNIVRDKAFLYGMSSPAPVADGDDTLYVPPTLGGKPVVEIEAAGIRADWNTKLHIPASVTSVRHGAVSVGGFYDYTNRLQWISVDSGNGYYKSVDGCLYTKDGRTFVLCPRGRLGRVTVASGTQYIADNAFNGCIGVTAISLPDTVVSIGASACACCWSRYVGNSYVYMTSLRSVNIPSSVRYVGNSVFSNCRELDIDVVIPEGVQRIGESAFADCSKIRSLSLPRSLVEIGSQAFSNCKNIGSVRFYENLRVIGRLAFSGCTSLSSGMGGANVHFCGYNAFEKTAMLPDALPDFVRGIGDSQYYNNASLTSVRIPGRIKVIGYYAFGSCENLTTIVIEEGVEDIRAMAFYNIGCTDLTIPASVSRFGYRDGTDGSQGTVYYAGSWDQPAAIRFKGLPPKGFSTGSIDSYVKVYYPQRYAAQWAAVVPTTSTYFGGYCN